MLVEVDWEIEDEVELWLVEVLLLVELIEVEVDWDVELDVELIEVEVERDVLLEVDD